MSFVTPTPGEWVRFEAQDGRTMTGQVMKQKKRGYVIKAGSEYVVPAGKLIARVVGNQ